MPPRITSSLVATNADSERFGDALGMAYNGIALFDLLGETPDHRLFIEAPIVTEAVFIEVGLQVITANRMIYAANSALHKTPKSFDGIRVHIARTYTRSL